MDHSESSEATISQERALEVSEAPNHIFSHQSDTSLVSSAAAECAGYEKRQLNEANSDNTSEGVNPLLELAANDNQAATNPAAKKRKKFRIVKNLLCIPKYIIHPIRLGKRLRSTFQRSNYKTITKDVRDEPPRDDERHPSDIDNAVNCNDNKSAPWPCDPAVLTAEEREMVGEPLYDCFIPTVDAYDERHPSDIDYAVNCSHWPSGPALTAEEIPPFGSEGDIGGATADVSLTQPLLNDTSNINCDINNDGCKIPMTNEEKRIIEELLCDCSPTVQRIVNAHNFFTIPPLSDETESDEEDSSKEEG